MFSVTPVPENNRGRKVSFSPDIDESYRHQVVDKIKNLMDEVQIIHDKEEKHLKKQQENDSWEFKQKQELELQAFLKKQREDAASFKTRQVNDWNNLKEKQTQETWRLFGKTTQQPSRPSITNMWGEQKSSAPSSRNSPWSPQSSSTASSPTWPKQNPWTHTNGDQKNKTEALTYWNANS